MRDMSSGKYIDRENRDLSARADRKNVRSHNMSQTRIEQLINEIYEYIENCKPLPVSQTKIIVQKDELLDLLDELKHRTPDEIKRYQRIIANRDSIIAQAEEKAKQIEEEARQKAKQLVDETDIMLQASAQATELLQSAKTESEKIRRETAEAAEIITRGALVYTGDVLAEIESLISSSVKETRENSERLLHSLESKLSTIHENQAEVTSQLEGVNGPADGGSSSAQDGGGDNFDFDSDTFLQGIE